MVVLGFVGVSAAGAAGSARIEVLSNRADLISGGGWTAPAFSSWLQPGG